VPLENARDARALDPVDKSDIDWLLKVDLLGLGMMAALQDAIDICGSGDVRSTSPHPKDDPPCSG